MTDKKKIDEAVTLTMNGGVDDQGVTVSSTVMANDMVELAMILKRAGITSAMYEGPASISDDNSDGISTTINAPNLRAIMSMMEPVFQAAGDLEAGVDNMAQDAEVPAEEPCVDGACDAPMDAPVVDVAPEAEVDMGADLAPVDEAVGGSALAQVFAAVPADAFEQAFGEMVGNLVGAYSSGSSASAIASWPEDTLNGIHKTPIDKQLCDAAEQEVIDHFHSLGEGEPDTQISALCEFIASQVGNPDSAEMMESEAEMAIGSWDGPGDEDDMDDLGYHDDDEDDVEESTEMQPYAGIADKKPVQPDTKQVPARSGDNPIKGFKDYFREATDRNFVAPVVETPVTGDTLLDEFRLNELSNDVKNSYFKKAAADINNHANHSEKMRGIGNNDQADKHDAKIMSRARGMHRAIAKEAELDEAGRADWQQKARQYGEPYYLNTDCGYASLDSIMRAEGFFSDMEMGLAQHATKVGFTVLEIDRNGKKGYNFVNSPDSRLQPGTPVTCVTQTSNGDKFRPGKFIASFTAKDLSMNLDQVEAELAKYGITPSKKLPVKTFD